MECIDRLFKLTIIACLCAYLEFVLSIMIIMRQVGTADSIISKYRLIVLYILVLQCSMDQIIVDSWFSTSNAAHVYYLSG